MHRSIWNWTGAMQRTPEEQAALAVRILRQRHASDVGARITERLGDRRYVVGKPDLSRNLLASWVARFMRAYRVPPLVDDLDPGLATELGDYSARTLIDRYASAGGRPMPTEQIRASSQALRYRIGAGYAGVLIDWSQREQLLALKVITPDDLDLTYGDDAYQEPTIIRHRARRTLGSELRTVSEVYDLTDLERPTYRVLDGDKDVTEAALGERYDGDAYPWRYANGVPFHRIVITGHPDDVYQTNHLVEATLITAVRWTAWGSGVDDASHPQRNVRGLRLSGQDTEADTGQSGISTGPETVLSWEDVDPERPGAHWQDAPAYDPEALGRAIRLYETSTLSALGLPIDLESTGGAPTEAEARALAELVSTVYPDCRRMDSEILRRSAATLNGLPADLVERDDYPEDAYGILYGEEVQAALASTENQEGQE